MSTITISKNNFEPIKADWIEQSGLKESDFMREVSFAVQAVNASPQLAKCSPASLMKSVINIAQSGLTLNPVSKYAYLVPRYKKNAGLEAVLEPSYMGLYKLLTDAGIVKSISCQLIYEGDEIEIDLAADKQVVKHVPYVLTGKPKGEIKGGYSLAALPDGNYHCEIMSAADFDDIKQRSESFKAFEAGKLKSCTWTTDKHEMSRKTIIKRHFKYLPKSGASDLKKVEQVETAINIDHEANGFAEKANLNAVYQAQTLINKANLREDEKTLLHEQLERMDYQHEVNSLIKYLNGHQQIVGVESLPHGQKEVKQAVAMKVAMPNT